MSNMNKVSSMDTFRVDKGRLLGALTANRALHKDLFLKAVEGYKIDALERLENRIEEIQKGDGIVALLFGIVLPEDHTNDYDVAIKSLEFNLDDEVWLTDTEFRQYVMDDWGWSASTFATNSGYASNVRR